MTKKKIILTFDYEMYLGEDSGTIEKCMLEPTSKILEILKRNNSKGLFFVDATFLTILKKDYMEGYLKVKKQILNILEFGNDIGLHIHPHWLDSYMISENRWSFKSYDNYRIHNLSEDKKTELIKDAFFELESICKECNHGYIIDSFRAGGWSVQPFEYIKNDLKNIGIKYDFSVITGMKKINLPRNYYDYSLIPKGRNFWRFENNVVTEKENGSFIEIATTTIRMNIFDILRNKKLIKGNRLIGDGKGADNSSSTLFKKLKKLKPFIDYTLSSDYMSLEQFKKNIALLDKDFMVFVAHPKNFSDESFEILEYICKNYNTFDYREIC